MSVLMLIMIAAMLLATGFNAYRDWARAAEYGDPGGKDSVYHNKYKTRAEIADKHFRRLSCSVPKTNTMYALVAYHLATIIEGVEGLPPKTVEYSETLLDKNISDLLNDEE